jgi:hypothetical protein
MLGKAFKKRYAAGRRELEHEFGKSMRYRSIRDLADGETGSVINDLKPIWLMSPCRCRTRCRCRKTCSMSSSSMRPARFPPKKLCLH